MRQDRLSDQAWTVHAGDTMRELRSGLQGLGGRPKRHPAWSDEARIVGATEDDRVLRLSESLPQPLRNARAA